MPVCKPFVLGKISVGDGSPVPYRKALQYKRTDLFSRIFPMKTGLLIYSTFLAAKRKNRSSYQLNGFFF